MKKNNTQKEIFQFDNTYARLPEVFHKKGAPIHVKKPDLILFNKELAESMNLQADDTDKEKWSQILSGNQLVKGSEPLAQAYAGHQFGHFTMLGDGRAILLGEHITSKGERLDVQLKGSGQTPYSRRGDGRATYYSMLREYLMSEAMHALRVPSNRSLALVKTGEEVFRESSHEGAVLTRIMSSHIRIGTFEYVRYLHPQHLEEFTQYVIHRHFPEIKNDKNIGLALLDKVMELQIDLVLRWLKVGLIHGVMNTDNTSICGETFDYGPCAFINQYDPLKTFSSIDHAGRYAFGNQPGIIHWNMGCLAIALLPLIHKDEETATEMAKQKLAEFDSRYNPKWLSMMGRKLGIPDAEASDLHLFHELLNWMQQNQADYTLTFLYLENPDLIPETASKSLYMQESFFTWHKKWKQRLSEKGHSWADAISLMQKSNPFVVPRNHKVEEALEQAAYKGNMEAFTKLSQALSRPYQRRTGIEGYVLPPEKGDMSYQTYCGT